MRTFLLSLLVVGVVAVTVGEGRADDWRRGMRRSGSGFSISIGSGRDRFNASWGSGSGRGYSGYGGMHSHGGYYSPYPVYSVPAYGPGYYSVPSYGGWHSHGRHCR